MECTRPILLIEDDPAARDAMTLVLEMDGYQVAPFSNGRDALEYLRKEGPVCVILLDLFTPVKDGWKFRQEQRKDPALAIIPVVIISGVSDVPAEASFLEAAGFIHKPIEAETLLCTVRLFAVPQQPAILVVEDRAKVGNLVSWGLQRCGFYVHGAGSGEDAMPVLAKHRGISLILVDLRVVGTQAAQMAADVRPFHPDIRCCFLDQEANPAAGASLKAQGAVHVFPTLGEAATVIRQIVR